jgi:hypothetical protein
MVRDRESVNHVVVIPGPFAASSRKEPDCVGRAANANTEAAEGERQDGAGQSSVLIFIATTKPLDSGFCGGLHPPRHRNDGNKFGHIEA